MGDTRRDITDKLTVIDIFKDTVEQSRIKYAGDTANVIHKMKFYTETPKITNISKGKKVVFVDGGTVNVGYAMAYSGRTAILNFADSRKPGGWVENGALTQEENICRCSNLHVALNSLKAYQGYYSINIANYGDGMATDTLMYLPRVAVFKDDCQYFEVPKRYVDVITCPAPSCYIESDKEAYDVYVRRITRIVTSAIDNGAENIVLGAWGCGAFRQNPELIARAFATVLNEYSGCFNTVVFAFKPTPNWGEGSVRSVFNKAFSDTYKFGVEQV